MQLISLRDTITRLENAKRCIEKGKTTSALQLIEDAIEDLYIRKQTQSFPEPKQRLTASQQETIVKLGYNPY